MRGSSQVKPAHDEVSSFSVGCRTSLVARRSRLHSPDDARRSQEATDDHAPAGRHRRVASGHPWVYSNEVAMDATAKALPAGSLVTLRSAGGEQLGGATFNPHTLVSARIFARDSAGRIDRGFFAERLEAALALRRRLYAEPFYRLVHAEADGLPGLVADRFGDVLVAQLNTAGMAELEGECLEACAAVLAPKAIVLRNDSAAHALEGSAWTHELDVRPWIETW
jgi:23S rRNA (cytosine1962-C5)-methyltransferase